MSTNSSKKRPAEAVDGKFAKAGRAKVTRTGRESAWRCFRRFEDELEETDDDEVKGEIIQNSLIAFADYFWIQRSEAITGLAWRLLRQ
jgi:hypothetical protein